jgi:thioredoxin-related protein
MSLRKGLLSLVLGLAVVATLAGRAVAADAPAKATATDSAAKAPAAELWTDNFADAKALAKKEGKDLLIDFTGSDWCIWCVRLKSEVFDTEKFKVEAPKKFVLVELDFPQKKKLAPEIKKQNDALQAQFNIQGFPTILLMDADGKVYARTGYQAGGPDKYMAHLDTLQKGKAEHAALVAAADKATGVEKAKILDKLVTMSAASGGDAAEQAAMIDDIIKLDAKNEAGLKAKYEKQTRMTDALKLAQSGKVAEGIKAIDQIIADYKLTGSDLQEALFSKARCQFRMGSKADAVTTLQAALEAAPQGELAPQIKSAIQSISAQK